MDDVEWEVEAEGIAQIFVIAYVGPEVEVRGCLPSLMKPIV